jgi:hypothetical protein
VVVIRVVAEVAMAVGKMVERPAGIFSAKTTVENVTGKVV